MVVWCRDDYIKEANKQLEDKSVYKNIDFNPFMTEAVII